MTFNDDLSATSGRVGGGRGCGATDTACGNATGQIGAFSCPTEANVYLDTGFFETLETRLGVENAPPELMYIVAHEWGHHIQSRTGAVRVADRQVMGPQAGQVSNPESWTHGSSNSRMAWFAAGYNENSRGQCDTWAVQQP